MDGDAINKDKMIGAVFIISRESEGLEKAANLKPEKLWPESNKLFRRRVPKLRIGQSPAAASGSKYLSIHERSDFIMEKTVEVYSSSQESFSASCSNTDRFLNRCTNTDGRSVS